MADEDGQERERTLEERQAAGLYPIGRALRATYDAENHDSLGQDLTGLMLALARVDEPVGGKAVVVAAPIVPSPAPMRVPAAGSWWARLWGRFGRAV